MNRIVSKNKIRLSIEPSTIFRPVAASAINVYTVTLKHGCKRLTLPQADRRKRPPTAGVVLESLVTDAAAYEKAKSYQQWCIDFGCDPEDPIAAREYRQMSWYAVALKDFLGDDLYLKAIADWEQERAEEEMLLR